MIQKPSTKELLAASFRELSASVPVNRITVKDIAQNCGYSPATFYRTFQDKYDLMAWDYARDVNAIMSKMGDAGYSWSDTLFEGAHYFESRREQLVNMLQHTEGRDSFERLMISQNYNSLRQCAISRSGKTALSNHEELCMQTYCMGTVHLCCEWLKGRIQSDPAEIAETWEATLPSVLYSYLYDS